LKPWRHYAVLCVFLSFGVALSVRVLYLGVTEHDFLQQAGDKRSVHKAIIPGMRGMIYDRNGEPLAVSTPVFAVSTNPMLAKFRESELRQIAGAIGKTKQAIKNSIEKLRPEVEVMYTFSGASVGVRVMRSKS
jgi:cell division protein FtsI (penicillin-binding protein 3)